MKIATGFVLFLLITALGFDEAFSQAPTLLDPQPGATNIVLPIFQKPFAGDYPLGNFFEHACLRKPGGQEWCKRGPH